MPAVFRPRRSLLYMPGSNPRALEKARGLPADGLIIDLEDAVAAEAKEGARAIVAAALAVGGYGARELVVRINPLDTPWGHADLAAVATMPIDAVLLPKVESADRVRLTVSLLDALGAPERLTVWCMIETPLAILQVGEIAAASPRLAALVLGTSDLTKDLHALSTRDRLPLVTSMSLAILAARGHRLAILDGVHLDLSDEEGLALACRQGREFGFDGKTLIHPAQIAPANTAYAPSPEEIKWSRRIITAHAEATAAGKGVVLIEGKLIEGLHVENARRLVALAEGIDRLAGNGPLSPLSHRERGEGGTREAGGSGPRAS
jgi:citrate lyase subunit beta / citryl-CoA lyase